MNCSMCKNKMTKKIETYHYTDCGLKNIILKKIEVLSCPHCAEEEIVIPRLEQLHNVIAKVIASQKYRLLPEEIRFLRSHLGWSGVDFAKAIAVTPESVSRWERGKEQMSLTLERFLRTLIVFQLGPFRDYKESLTAYGLEKHKKSFKRVFVAKNSEWQEAA